MALLLVALGCGTPTQQPVMVVTTTKPVTTTSWNEERARDSIFLELVKPWAERAGQPLSDVKPFALDICADLDDGFTEEEILVQLAIVGVEMGWDDSMAEYLGFVVGLAPAAYCPHHSN